MLPNSEDTKAAAALMIAAEDAEKAGVPFPNPVAVPVTKAGAAAKPARPASASTAISAPAKSSSGLVATSTAPRTVGKVAC